MVLDIIRLFTLSCRPYCCRSHSCSHYCSSSMQSSHHSCRPYCRPFLPCRCRSSCRRMHRSWSNLPSIPSHSFRCRIHMSNPPCLPWRSRPCLPCCCRSSRRMSRSNLPCLPCCFHRRSCRPYCRPFHSCCCRSRRNSSVVDEMRKRKREIMSITVK